MLIFMVTVISAAATRITKDEPLPLGAFCISHGKPCATQNAPHAVESHVLLLGGLSHRPTFLIAPPPLFLSYRIVWLTSHYLRLSANAS